MSKKSFLRLNFFLTFIIMIGVLLSAVAFLVSRYPWPVLLSDLSLAKESAFVGHWPVPALDDDRQERKKLKRFPKSEQQRRLGIIMRRMDYLNVPIFDFFLDQGVQVFSPDLPLGSSAMVPLIWPSFPSKRRIGSEDSSFRDVRYLVLPSSFGAQCVEGMHLTSGDELRTALPPAKIKRNITFSVLPLAPSSLRAWIGQFSWARQFNDSEVNKVHSISIPINDPAASSLRLSMGSGSLLLSAGAIAHWDRSGRIPIQLGNQSLYWRSANEKFATDSQNSSAGPAEEGAEDSSSLATQSPSGGATAGQTGATAGESQDKAENITAGAAQTASFSDPKSTLAAETKASKGQSAPDDLLDPESVKFNQVVNVNGLKSVALGYNALLIQLDPSMNQVFSDPELFRALAPRLHSFLGTALRIPLDLPPIESNAEIFQNSIVRQNGEVIPFDIPILTKDLISRGGVFNLYQEFRNFGYKVVSFAPPKALSMPESLSRGSGIPKLEGRWLDNNDWRFVARRKELDQQNEPVTGLEAIFKNDQLTTSQSIADSDFLKFSEMLEGLERESDSIPDWRANEISIINHRSQYLPRLVDSFQRWMKDNYQIRFFAHLYLSDDDLSLRPTFKDFLKVLRFRKLKALALSAQTEKLTRLVMTDRVFGQILDTLVARRTYHRTVVGVVLPAYSASPASVPAKFLISVPGLNARKFPSEKKLQLDDALSTLGQMVGVQFNTTDSTGKVIFRGNGLEKDLQSREEKLLESANGPVGSQSVVAEVSAKSDEESRKGKKAERPSGSDRSDTGSPVVAQLDVNDEKAFVSRYRMILLPRAAGCQPFEWTASTPYFGLQSSQPVVEEPAPRGRVIRVFPCGLKDQVIELSWYQNHTGARSDVYTATNAGEWLGGTFTLSSASRDLDSGDAPLFLLGPRALAADSLPLRLRRFAAHEVSNIFELPLQRQPEKETFARVLNMTSQIQGQSVSARTLVYFFREPVRR